MSSGNSKLSKNVNILFENNPEINMKLSKAFSPFPKDATIDYIYDGSEQIPFKDRHPLYQFIFIQEFVE
jgi:hypothetical protein